MITILLLAVSLLASELSSPRSYPAERQAADMMRPDAFDVQPLADGVYAFVRRDPVDDAVNSNVLVIISDVDVIVVDGNLAPSSAAGTIAAIRKLTPLPVRYVINTHWHDDHVLGNSQYAETFPGVEFIAHPYTRLRMFDTVAASLDGYKTAYPQELKGIEERLAKGTRRDGAPMTREERTSLERAAALFRAMVAQLPRMRITPPTLLVDRTMTIWRGTREIRLTFLGRGNTAGDLIVHLPAEGIVATGDLVVHPIPFGFGSYPGEWIETLDRLKALEARVWMPGHGEVQRDTRYMTSLQELLGAIRVQMRDAVAKGLTLEQARAALDLEAFRARFAGDNPRRRTEFAEFFVEPISERAYLEAQGKLQ
jgi:cyclase